MKYIHIGYCDIETMTTYSREELETLYRIESCSAEFRESFPYFNLWLSEICGKNGTFVKVYKGVKE